MSLAAQVCEAIRSVVGRNAAPLHEPQFQENEWLYVKECLDSTFVSSVGKFVERFEVELAAFTGAKHAVAVVNGTAALHVALKLAGVLPGDEVLIPTLTFVATANAVAYCGAVPHFADSEEKTLGIDARKLRDHLEACTEMRSGCCVNRKTGRVVRALVPMHTFGHPSDLEALQSVAQDFSLALVEDAAESIGSYYRGRHTGTFGLLGTLSFNGNKTITTGGGGAILTDDEQLAKHAKHLTTTAKVQHPWEYRHDEVGYNYRMPNINAALGCAQLERLPTMLCAKRYLHAAYKAAFAPVGGICLVREPEHCRSNYWLQALLLDRSRSGERDAIIRTANDGGMMARPAWELLHTLPPFRECPGMDLSCSKSLSERLVNIPSGAGLAASGNEKS